MPHFPIKDRFCNPKSFHFIGLPFNKVDFGEGEVAFFSAKRWDGRNRADLIESVTPCHDAQEVGPYRDSNPLRLTVLTPSRGPN